MSQDERVKKDTKLEKKSESQTIKLEFKEDAYHMLRDVRKCAEEIGIKCDKDRVENGKTRFVVMELLRQISDKKLMLYRPIADDERYYQDPRLLGLKLRAKYEVMGSMAKIAKVIGKNNGNIEYNHVVNDDLNIVILFTLKKIGNLSKIINEVGRIKLSDVKKYNKPKHLSKLEGFDNSERWWSQNLYDDIAYVFGLRFTTNNEPGVLAEITEQIASEHFHISKTSIIHDPKSEKIFIDIQMSYPCVFDDENVENEIEGRIRVIKSLEQTIKSFDFVDSVEKIGIGTPNWMF